MKTYNLTIRIVDGKNIIGQHNVAVDTNNYNIIQEVYISSLLNKYTILNDYEVDDIIDIIEDNFNANKGIVNIDIQKLSKTENLSVYDNHINDNDKQLLDQLLELFN